jgi:hypothetical protein
MYIMPYRSPFEVDHTTDPSRLSDVKSELRRPGRAAHWRGYLASLEMLGVAAFIIAAPLADREFVPATFVDQIGAAFDASMADDSEFTLPETAGEPAISMATSNGEPGAPMRVMPRMVIFGRSH